MTTAPIQKIKSQHYVPRCYLKNFADPKTKEFFSFNKLFKKSRRASVAQSAQEEFFYDYHESTLHTPEDDPQLVEKALGKIENRFKELLDEFIAATNIGIIPIELAG